MAQTRIIYFTKYTRAGASSRYRSYQYFDGLKKQGCSITAFPLFPDKYIEIFYRTGRKPLLLVIKAYLQRIFQLLTLKDHDIVFVEYELFPFLPLWLEKLFIKKFRRFILDYDDAIFHNYDETGNRIIRCLLAGKIYRLTGLADAVITGSPYLTEKLSGHAARVVEIPTSLDLQKYVVKQGSQDFVIRICWIGSKTTSINIQVVAPAIRRLQESRNFVLVLVGFDTTQTAILEHIDYEIVNWTSAGEVEAIASCDLGIMPLLENKFNLGKCGFKLLQYMACGLPTISTPFPANVKINRDNNNLFAADEKEWVNALEKMLNDLTCFISIVGSENRRIVEKYYSVDANLPVYSTLFQSLIQPGSNVN